MNNMQITERIIRILLYLNPILIAIFIILNFTNLIPTSLIIYSTLLYIPVVIIGISIAILKYYKIKHSANKHENLTLVTQCSKKIKLQNMGSINSGHKIENNPGYQVNLLSSNLANKDPIKAIKLARMILLKILEYIKKNNLREIVNNKEYSGFSILDLIEIWENRIKNAISSNTVNPQVARNYITFITMLYEYFSKINITTEKV
ncbi:MAG: hypothetical protein ACTSYQ_04220 [Candidatus Odinarchaeia archaeon]